MANHLAVYNRTIFHTDYIQMMLSGDKSTEIKLGYRRVAPFGKLTAGDYMYIKEASGPVVGRVLIPEVKDYVLDPGSPELLEILPRIQETVGLRDAEHAHAMFEKNQYKRYATVFSLAKPEQLEHPVRIYKNNMSTWIANYELPVELQFAFGISDAEMKKESKRDRANEFRHF